MEITKDTMFCDTPEYRKEVEDYFKYGGEVEFVDWDDLRAHIKGGFNLPWSNKRFNAASFSWTSVFYRKKEVPAEIEWEYLYKVKNKNGDYFYLDTSRYYKNDEEFKKVKYIGNIEDYEKQEWSKSRRRK